MRSLVIRDQLLRYDCTSFDLCLTRSTSARCFTRDTSVVSVYCITCNVQFCATKFYFYVAADVNAILLARIIDLSLYGRARILRWRPARPFVDSSFYPYDPLKPCLSTPWFQGIFYFAALIGTMSVKDVPFPGVESTSI